MNANKILVVGPSWVGDMVMTHTLLLILKTNHPDVIIDVLAPAWSQGLLARMPEVRKSIVLPFKHKQLKLWQRIAFGKQLRAEQYDQVILIPNSLKSLIIPLAAKIPKRTGWNGKEWPRRFFLNDGRTLDTQRYPLMVQRFAALAFSAQTSLPVTLPWPLLQVNSQDLANTLQHYQLAAPQVPLLIIAPGAEFGPSKKWPPEYFAQVAEFKLQQGWQVWLCGSINDQPVAAEIDQLTGNKCVNLVGKTSLAEAIDLLSLATVVVSNDSGLMHIAAALQRPVVAIYGSTPHTVTPPLSPKTKILSLNLPCSPCYKRECPLQHWRCMRDLKPELVLTNIDLLLQPH